MKREAPKNIPSTRKNQAKGERGSFRECKCSKRIERA